MGYSFWGEGLDALDSLENLDDLEVLEHLDYLEIQEAAVSQSGSLNVIILNDRFVRIDEGKQDG